MNEHSFPEMTLEEGTSCIPALCGIAIKNTVDQKDYMAFATFA
ncbi:hypothetical protein [Bartonella apihabitans]|nr:hypothetical protein [Bartonella apihabitans]